MTSADVARARRGLGAVRVWDCFLVNDEVELLRFRLEELASVVDVFVLVESPWTFTGRPKPLYVAEAWEALGPYHTRIRHVVTDDRPPAPASAWDCERAQRRSIRSALGDVDADDLIIVGDVDEIPAASVVERLRYTLREPIRLVMDHALLAANLKMPAPWTDGPKACRGHQLGNPEMALLLGDPAAVWRPINLRTISGAGWHLSFLGGHEVIARKLASYSHTELDTPFNRSKEHIGRCVRYGVDLTGQHLLRRLDPAELPPLLEDLRRAWPEVFDFRPDAPKLPRLLYRAYTRACQIPGTPPALKNLAEWQLWALLIATSPLLLGYDLAARVLDRWRARRPVRSVTDVSQDELEGQSASTGEAAARTIA